MLHLLQMGPSKVLTTFPLQIQSSWQLSLLELPSCRITVTPSSDISDMYTSTVQSSSASANAALPPHPRLQTTYPPSAHYISSSSAPHHRPLLLAFLLRLLSLLSPPRLSQGSSMECWRSSSQELITTPLSFVPSCRSYLHSGIQA